jgi:GTP-binding protein
MVEATGPNDPLVIRSLEFLGGTAERGGWRPLSELPEVAFAGRSNVGKSSLLNSLVGRRKMARVSKTPGRTREINFFRVNNAFVLVDLPGYGYAKISKERKADWKPLMESYFKLTPQLRGIVLLLDIRRDPSDDDREMLDFLSEVEIPTIVAVTKSDKLTKSAVAATASELARKLGLSEDQVIPFSSRTGEGRRELAEAMMSLVNAPAPVADE